MSPLSSPHCIWSTKEEHVVVFVHSAHVVRTVRYDNILRVRHLSLSHNSKRASHFLPVGQYQFRTCTRNHIRSIGDISHLLEHEKFSRRRNKQKKRRENQLTSHVF